MNHIDRITELDLAGFPIIDHVEHVKKYNKNHDELGRFTTSGGGGGVGGAIAVGPGTNGASAAGLEGFGRSRIIRAMTLATSLGAKDINGTISGNKVREAKKNGGAMKDVRGKNYLLIPEKDGTITAYTGTKGRNGGMNAEKYKTGFRTMKDAEEWGTGTILNERMTVKQFKNTWEIK